MRASVLFEPGKPLEVEDEVVVELKAISALALVHTSQMLSYLAIPEKKGTRLVPKKAGRLN